MAHEKKNIHEMTTGEYLNWLEENAFKRYCSVPWESMTDTWVADHNRFSPFSQESGCFHRAYQRAQEWRETYH